MNSFIAIWIIAMALCFLSRFVFEKRNMQASIFSFFLGILTLGLGLLSLGGYYAVTNALSNSWGQSIVDVFLLLIGAGCVWISARPITSMVQSWLK